MLWFDEHLHDQTVVPFDVADRGLLLGDGVFDTALVLGGVMVWREAHVSRLAAACETLGFPLDRAAADRAIAALIAAMPDGAVRINVTRGGGPRGLAPPRAAAPRLWASIAPLRPGGFFAPLTLGVAKGRRNETSPVSGLKALGYLDAILASRDAAAAGFDDSLFLNTQGRAACATIGNIIVLTGTRLMTPPLADGVLPGITRAMLLRLAGAAGLDPHEQSLTLADLDMADAVFVTNSLKLLAPVMRIGDRAKAVPSDLRVASLISAISMAIKAECGIDPRTLPRV